MTGKLNTKVKANLDAIRHLIRKAVDKEDWVIYNILTQHYEKIVKQMEVQGE